MRMLARSRTPSLLVALVVVVRDPFLLLCPQPLQVVSVVSVSVVWPLPRRRPQRLLKLQWLLLLLRLHLSRVPVAPPHCRPQRVLSSQSQSCLVRWGQVCVGVGTGVMLLCLRVCPFVHLLLWLFPMPSA